jgi:hypothetical protein
MYYNKINYTYVYMNNICTHGMHVHIHMCIYVYMYTLLYIHNAYVNFNTEAFL